MTKLVIFAPSFYPNNGGVEKHLGNIVKLLKKKNYNITVFVRYSKGLPKRQNFYGIEVIRMPKSNSKVVMMAWYSKYKKILSGSVIHSHDYFPNYLRKILKNNRWVHTFHGYEGYPLDPLAIKSRQNVARNVDYSFCVGKFVEKWYGTKCNDVIWGAAEKPKQIKKTIKYDFIFFGRFERDTGFEEYIKAFKLIKEREPSTLMAVIGWGSKLGWAKKYSERHKLDISFVPPKKNIYPYIGVSRIAFVSGYQAIIESALMKKPIVAYFDTPIKRDYLKLHPMSQYLNISSSSSEIAHKAVVLLNSENKKYTNLYNWAKNQNWNMISTKYIKSYKEQKNNG